MPEGTLPARLIQHLPPDSPGKPAHLREDDGLRRGDPAAPRALPPEESLHADDPAAVEVHAGLEVHL